MDPLSVLRVYATRGNLDKITRNTAGAAAEIHFLNPTNPSSTAYTFPASLETPYRSKQGIPYTLESLLFFLHNHQLKHTDYLQQARTLSIPAVTFTDRKPLLDFLLSKSPSSLPILPPLPFDGPLPEEPPQKRPALAAPRDSDVGDEGDGKDEVLDVMAMIRAVERPLRDRESILECRNRDFYSVLVSSTKREEERQRMEMQQRKDGLVAKNRLMGTDDRSLGLGLGFGGVAGEEQLGFGDMMGSSGAMASSGSKSKMGVKKVGLGGEGVPIILVPSAFQTLITIYNVKEFLEDGVYVPTEVKVKGMGKKPEVVTVQRKFSSNRERGGVRAAYEVRDKVAGLRTEDWERVVAAFVLGKEWQFKDWPFKDHVEIFNKSE